MANSKMDLVKTIRRLAIFSYEQLLHLGTIQIKKISGLIACMRHILDSYSSGPDLLDEPFHPCRQNEWEQHTPIQMRTYLIQHHPSLLGPNPVPAGPITSSRPTGYSTEALELMGFKKAIKREIAVYPSLRDERYFDSLSRTLFIVIKAHECSDVLGPTYTPGSEPEQKGLIEAKQTFVYSAFNANHLTDMGKTIVRKHLNTTDPQAAWQQLSDHMRTSSKGSSEKRRLTQYVTNTVLDDNFIGSTERFVLHFNEQFRQLDEVSDNRGNSHHQ